MRYGTYGSFLPPMTKIREPNKIELWPYLPWRRFPACFQTSLLVNSTICESRLLPPIIKTLFDVETVLYPWLLKLRDFFCTINLANNVNIFHLCNTSVIYKVPVVFHIPALRWGILSRKIRLFYPCRPVKPVYLRLQAIVTASYKRKSFVWRQRTFMMRISRWWVILLLKISLNNIDRVAFFIHANWIFINSSAPTK